MSTVQRNVVLSSIEPAPLSFRAPAQMETWLDIQFTTQAGQVYNQDLAAQLQLTGRSSGRTVSYPMPAIDIVNGKARAVFPHGELTDMNGYRIRLFGTWKQQPWLLAMGTLALIPAAGVDAMPDDVIDSVDLVFTYGAAASVDVSLWHDTGKTVPYDLATTNVTAIIYMANGGPVLMSFTVTASDENTVTLTLTLEQVNSLPQQSWWTLVASTVAGATTLAQGNVTVKGTPP